MSDSHKQPTDEDLKPFGWAPGDYFVACINCPTNMQMKNGGGAKRSYRCKHHATHYWLEANKDDPLIRMLTVWPFLDAEHENMTATEIMRQAAAKLQVYRTAVFSEGNARVGELIKANSVEVVRYRVANAHRKVLLQAVQKAATQFRYYAKSHRNKVAIMTDPKAIEDTLAKAEVNDQFATEMEAAFTWEIDPNLMGRP
jgi:hypothetical protein